MKASFILRLLTSVAIALFCCYGFTSCGDDKPAGPTLSADSLNITTVDSDGNPISGASIFYTCWVPLAAGQSASNDCRASNFTRTLPIKPDSQTIIEAFPSPCTEQAVISFGLSKEAKVQLSLYDYSRSILVKEFIKNDILRPGIHALSFSVSEIPASKMPYPGQASMNGLYWVKLNIEGDTTTYWKKFLIFDRTKPMYKTNSSGNVAFPYQSLPFSEQMNRTTDNGTILGTFVVQGDYLYVKCTAPGYKDAYGFINAYERKEHMIRLVMEK